MAIGDIDGDLPSTYGARKKQTSYDMTNFPAGPVGRASQQLNGAGAQVASVAPVAPPAPASLSTLPVAPQPSLASVSNQPSAIPPGQTSFDATNTPNQYLRQTAAPATPSLQSVAPVAPTGGAVSSLDQFQGTGIGTGARGGPIAVSQGADGVPSFSNLPAAQQQAASLGNIQPRAATGPSASDDPNASLASIGSLSNLGNGRGTFSQSQAGDAALATGRFDRAAQLRQGYADQDRLTAALNANDRANSLTIVRDSSKPFTRSELIQAQLDQQAQQGRLAAISAATANLNGGIDRQGAEQQLRQASRLEDLQVAATGPNATPEAQAAYQSAIDPTGEKALARQLTTANINKTNADAEKAKGEASGSNPQAQLTKLNAEKAQRDLDQSAQAQTTQQEGSLDIAKRARDLANSIPKNGQFDKITGTLDSMTPTLLGSSKDLINQANQLQTLLTADNLKLMSGVLTDKDVEFLSQIGSGLAIGSKGIDGSEEGTRKGLKDISDRLTQKIGQYEKNKAPGNSTGAALPARTSAAAASASTIGVTPGAPQVGTVQSGYVFLGGDPASPSSWRAQ
jgi:hypothetical protein